MGKMYDLTIKKKTWDSNFWGIDIYDAIVNKQIDRIKEKDSQEIQSEQYILQILVGEKDNESAIFLQEKNFQFIETKVTFEKQIEKEIVLDHVESFKTVEKKDMLVYEKKFYDMYGRVSRYALFEKRKINDFYFIWACKSMNGELDDRCIGFYINNILSGFITYKIDESALIIGLLGVFPDYQGKKISKKLLNYVNNVAYENKCSSIIVATQGKNLKAINTYISNDYYISNIQQWYYYLGGWK